MRWGRLGLGRGLFEVCFAFPWGKTAPDDGQSSGGFNFFGDGLRLHWGKSHGQCCTEGV